MNRMLFLNVATLLFSIAALAVAVTMYVNQPKIAYVNNSTLLNEYNGMKEGQRLLEEKLGTWQNNLDTLEADIDQYIRDYRENFPTMDDQERARTEKFIKEQQERFFSYREQIEENAGVEEAKISNELIAQINNYLNQYGERKDLDIIIGVTDGGNVLYGKNEHDITAQVISNLNNSYEGN